MVNRYNITVRRTSHNQSHLIGSGEFSNLDETMAKFQRLMIENNSFMILNDTDVILKLYDGLECIIRVIGCPKTESWKYLDYDENTLS